MALPTHASRYQDVERGPRLRPPVGYVSGFSSDRTLGRMYTLHARVLHRPCRAQVDVGCISLGRDCEDGLVNYGLLVQPTAGMKLRFHATIAIWRSIPEIKPTAPIARSAMSTR